MFMFITRLLHPLLSAGGYGQRPCWLLEARPLHPLGQIAIRRNGSQHRQRAVVLVLHPANIPHIRLNTHREDAVAMHTFSAVHLRLLDTDCTPGANGKALTSKKRSRHQTCPFWHHAQRYR